ncbi:hypothetical protein ACQKP9_12820, partial [Pseudomonas mandelii]
AKLLMPTKIESSLDRNRQLFPIRRYICNTVISMEQTTTEVVRGARLAQDAGVALEEIEGVSKTLAALIQSISNAAQQQTSSAGQISLTMNVIQQITTQTSSGSTATAESIGNLAKMASQLRRSVSGFTLPAAKAQAADKV